MSDTTTVRTSATKALEAWREAQRAVQFAGARYADLHTAAAKRALREAQDREVKALREYTQACYAKHAAVLAGTVRPRS